MREYIKEEISKVEDRVEVLEKDLNDAKEEIAKLKKRNTELLDSSDEHTRIIKKLKG